jgi:4-hydroxybenzoate polyprenyltransferase
MPETPLAWWRPAFARAYVVTMRPYLLFVSGAAGLVGLSFLPDPTVRRVVPAFAALFLSYGFGQALTDCFQTDTDQLSAPYRPLVAGLVSRRQVMTTSLAGLGAVIAVLAWLNPAILILGLLAVLGLATYTYFKRTWWGGPPWNSWIVALLPLMGRLADRGYRVSSFVRAGTAAGQAFPLAVLAVFFGYANFVVMGYFKDISADRETGYRTFPVVFGWRPAAIYGDVTAALAAALTACVLVIVGPNPWSVAALAAGVALHLYAQVAMHLAHDERKVGGPIANSVRALILYCIAIVAANAPGWAPLLAVYYGCFEVALRFRPERGQV